MSGKKPCYPKVLIISHCALSLHSNNGKTIASFFKEWPYDHVSQIYFHLEEPESDKFHRFFRVTDIDIIKSVIFFTRKCVGNVMTANKSSFSNPLVYSESHNSKLLRIVRKNKNIVRMLRNYLFKAERWKSINLLNWIDDCKPDIVLLHASDYTFTFRIALDVAKHIDIPLAIFFTDDYLLYPANNDFLSNILHRGLYKIVSEAIDASSQLFVIGEQMALEYGQRFGRDCLPVINAIDLDSEKIPLKESPTCDRVLLTYMGGLHLDRWKMLLALGSMLRYICNKSRINATLEIYTISNPSDDIINQLNEWPLKYGGRLIGEQVKNKIIESDVLVHVESDDMKTRNITRLSVSTKIPEYLSSGNCVLCFGPSEVASIKIIMDHNIGVAITNEDVEEQKIEKLTTLLLNQDVRRAYGQKGYAYAFNHMNGIKIRELFTDRMIKAARK